MGMSSAAREINAAAYMRAHACAHAVTGPVTWISDAPARLFLIAPPIFAHLK